MAASDVGFELAKYNYHLGALTRWGVESGGGGGVGCVVWFAWWRRGDVGYKVVF